MRLHWTRARRGVMAWMNDSRWLASSLGTDLGDLAVFSGFDREDLLPLASDWRLELAPALETGADCYQIVRESWSEEATAVCLNAKRDVKPTDAYGPQSLFAQLETLKMGAILAILGDSTNPENHGRMERMIARSPYRR